MFDLTQGGESVPVEILHGFDERDEAGVAIDELLQLLRRQILLELRNDHVLHDLLRLRHLACDLALRFPELLKSDRRQR